MKHVFACFVVLALASLVEAADIAGKWSGDVPGRGGDTTPATFTFKVDGDKLTGSMTGAQGEVPLQDGKVSGASALGRIDPGILSKNDPGRV